MAPNHFCPHWAEKSFIPQGRVPFPLVSGTKCSVLQDFIVLHTLWPKNPFPFNAGISTLPSSAASQRGSSMPSLSIMGDHRLALAVTLRLLSSIICESHFMRCLLADFSQAFQSCLWWSPFSHPSMQTNIPPLALVSFPSQLFPHVPLVFHFSHDQKDN